MRASSRVFWASVSFIFFSFNVSQAEISFPFSTTFDCVDVKQGALVNCGGMEWGGNWSFIRTSLADGVANNWTQSTVASNEYYFSATLPNLYTRTPRSVSTKTEILDRSNAGSLVSGKWAWGDIDGIGHDTIYIYAESDPDLNGDEAVVGYMSFSNWVDITEDSYVSSITSDANNPAGLGGKGFRVWDGDGQNIDTGPAQATFPAPQQELWIRWYQRHEQGFKWRELIQGRVPLYDKQVYLFTGAANTSIIAEYRLNTYALVAQNTPNYYQVVTEEGEGWTRIMGGDESDGQWHCFELHVKMDTDGTNGIGKIWIDGVLKASNTAVNWSGVGKNTTREIAKAQEGWTYFKLSENQAWPQNILPMYVDVDDMVVYNQTPPNRDAHGNPFIGPIFRVHGFERN